MNLEARITYNPIRCGGKPCVGSMRIRVSDILQMLGEGRSAAKRFYKIFPIWNRKTFRIACCMPLAGLI